MELMVYLYGIIAVFATLRVITHKHPVYALLYLIISLMAIACIFFSIGAYFIGALEIIIYAGAIMVLFVFVIMMLNIKKNNIRKQEHFWLTSVTWFWPSLLSIILLIIIVQNILHIETININSNKPITDKSIGMALFGPYVIAVELASILLLAGLIVSFHLGHNEKK